MYAKTLTPQEVAEIYTAHMLRDFPPDERKPLSAIQTGMEKGLYETFGLMEEDTLLGYGFFVKLGRDYLLDYLAVLPEYRNHGYGTTFLQLLREQLPNARSILVEVEDPACGADASEQALRTRRVGFYFRNGLVDTGLRAETFGVVYWLIAMDLGCPLPQQDIRTLYPEFYRALLPAHICEKMVKVLR